MITYKKLYSRVRESTGLDVLTPGALQTIIENCFADMTGRGYREFQEDVITNITDLGNGLYSIPYNPAIKKILHIKCAQEKRMDIAFRVSLSDPTVNSLLVDEGVLRTNFSNINKEAIYYVNGETIFIELYNRDAILKAVYLGYDKRLIVTEEQDPRKFEETTIAIKKDFEDAIVLYGIYFILSRYSKDTDRVQMALNNYKYFMEDLTATLAVDDNFTDTGGIVILDRV